MVLAGPGYAGEGFRSCLGLMVGAYKRLNWTFHISRHLKHEKFTKEPLSGAAHRCSHGESARLV